MKYNDSNTSMKTRLNIDILEEYKIMYRSSYILHNSWRNECTTLFEILW